MGRGRWRRERPIGIAAAVAGFLCMLAVGIYLPDIDQGLPFLTHRSALTHSVLPMLVLWRLLPPALQGGLAVGIAVTLSADLFPESWTGFATIHLPFLGRLGIWSPLWIAANMLIACVVAHRDVAGADRRRPLVLTYFIAAPLAATAYSIGNEEKLLPLVAFLAGWGCVLAYSGTRRV